MDTYLYSLLYLLFLCCDHHRRYDLLLTRNRILQNDLLRIFRQMKCFHCQFSCPIAMIPLEQLVIEQLLKGPSTIDGVSSKDIQATIPKDTILNKVTLKEHTCYVDFSEQFLNKPDGITAEVAIYSVVNTLIELPDITKVQFSINGKQELFYNDSMPFGDVFTRNLDLVQ